MAFPSARDIVELALGLAGVACLMGYILADDFWRWWNKRK